MKAAYAASTSTTDGGSIYQTVELDAGVTYRLTAGVAQSASVSKNTGNFALVFFNTDFSTLLAQTTGTVLNQSAAGGDLKGG